VSPDKLVGLPKGGKVPDKQVELAQQIVASLSDAFKPERYHDEFRERVLELVRKKSKGQKIEKPAPGPEPKSNVVDLMAALRASLGAAAGASKGQAPNGKRRPAKRPAHRALKTAGRAT
jgi:DNA end-binding protein Ku